MKIEYRECQIQIFELSGGTFCHSIRVTGTGKSIGNGKAYKRSKNCERFAKSIIDSLHKKGIIRELDVR